VSDSANTQPAVPTGNGEQAASSKFERAVIENLPAKTAVQKFDMRPLAERYPLFTQHPEVAVDDLGLTNLTANCLKRNSITRFGAPGESQLAGMNEDDLLHLRNFGLVCLADLLQALERHQERGTPPAATKPTTRAGHQTQWQGLRTAIVQVLKDGGIAKGRIEVAERASALLRRTVTPSTAGQMLTALAANDLVRYHPGKGWAVVEKSEPTTTTPTEASPLSHLLQQALEAATDEEAIRRLTPAITLLGNWLSREQLGYQHSAGSCHNYLTDHCKLPISPGDTRTALELLVDKGTLFRNGNRYTHVEGVTVSRPMQKEAQPPTATQLSREQLLAGLLGGIPTDECLLVDRPGSRVAIVLPDGSPFYDQEGASIRVQIWRQ